MIAKQLFDQGRLREAAQALGAHLRDHPTDTTQRIFLFELLCFSGEYDRAEKHLEMLSQGGPTNEMGAMLYRAALHAERTRHELFTTQAFPKSGSPPTASLSGSLNGLPFSTITDVDPDIGARLEVYAAGSYLWIPFSHVASVHLEAPRKLRDTLWAPAVIKVADGYQKEYDFGEALIPAVYPFSWKCEDETVALGRTTAWGEDEQGHQYPLGQKMLMVDGNEIAFLEIRSLVFDSRQPAKE